MCSIRQCAARVMPSVCAPGLKFISTYVVSPPTCGAARNDARDLADVARLRHELRESSKASPSDRVPLLRDDGTLPAPMARLDQQYANTTAKTLSHTTGSAASATIAISLQLTHTLYLCASCGPATFLSAHLVGGSTWGVSKVSLGSGRRCGAFSSITRTPNATAGSIIHTAITTRACPAVTLRGSAGNIPARPPVPLPACARCESR